MVRLLEVFFSDPLDDAYETLRPLNDYYGSEGPRSLSRITLHFGDLTPDEEAEFEQILLGRQSTFWISLRFSRTGSISFDASRRPGVDEARQYYERVISRFHFVKIPSIRVADGSTGRADSLERLLDTLEAVLVRKGNARSTSLQQAFTDKMQPVEGLVREVLDQSAASIKNDLPFRENTVQFRLPESRHALRGMLSAAVIESSGAVELPVAQRGTGFQSALVMGILRYVAHKESQSGGNIFFAIEEPEAFLHPQTQRAMAKIIRDISADAQVLVTTHSSVLVDSFGVDQIVRLPLNPQGLEHTWERPELEATDVGRLTRYCSAANSELLFANAVILVEGESDFAVVERLLGDLCGAPGGHYALGLTVIDAGGLEKIKYLVQLANLFGVRSYVLADRDSLHGQRSLLEILKERREPPSQTLIANLIQTSDSPCQNLTAALVRQKAVNALLAPYDTFVMASDLEGVLLDLFGPVALAAELGPHGHRFMDDVVAAEAAAPGGRERLAAKIGSRGWDSTGRKTGKLPPHIPPLLIDSWKDQHHGHGTGRALVPLVEWLREIAAAAKLAPV